MGKASYMGVTKKLGWMRVRFVRCKSVHFLLVRVSCDLVTFFSRREGDMLCLVARSRLTLCDPMDCSPPGSCVLGNSPGKTTGVGCHALLWGIIPTQGSNLGLLHCRWILYHMSHQGSPRVIMWNAGLDGSQAEIKIAGRNINNLRYADDATLMAKSKEEIKSLLIGERGEWKSWLETQLSKN